MEGSDKNFMFVSSFSANANQLKEILEDALSQHELSFESFIKLGNNSKSTKFEEFSKKGLNFTKLFKFMNVFISSVDESKTFEILLKCKL